MRQAIRERDVPALKKIWDRLIPIWDDRSFYDFVATSYAFGGHSFQHREIFGQVGFGTGGWDSDYPNSMLEILRVVATECDENQHFHHVADHPAHVLDRRVRAGGHVRREQDVVEAQQRRAHAVPARENRPAGPASDAPQPQLPGVR